VIVSGVHSVPAAVASLAIAPSATMPFKARLAAVRDEAGEVVGLVLVAGIEGVVDKIVGPLLEDRVVAGDPGGRGP